MVAAEIQSSKVSCHAASLFFKALKCFKQAVRIVLNDLEELINKTLLV